MKLLWKLKLDNAPLQLNSLTSPVVINPVYTNHGVETYVAVAGSSDNLYVIDADTGKLVWDKHFTNQAPPPSGPQSSNSYFCPNALNDTPVIDQGAAGPSVDVISIDGRLHSLNIVNGEDRFPAKEFVPPYSKNWSLLAMNGYVYTTTSQGCGRSRSGVWAMNLADTKMPVTYFQSDSFGAGVWGRGGAAAGTDGTLYVATGDGPVDSAKGKFSDSVMALSPKDLKVTNYYTPENANYITRKDLDMGNSTPVVFDYKGRELLVIGGKEGKLFLLDTKSIGGETHREPLYETPVYLNEGADIAGHGFWGAFSSWQDESGTRWVYAAGWGALASTAPKFPIVNGPTPDGMILAFKVEDQGGKPVLTPAWVSQNMAVPEPPVVTNGVVFALSSGEFVRQVKESGSLYTAAERVALTKGNATLYALDAATGKKLYSSGDTIPSFTHLGGLAVSDGRVFLTTHDSMVYAFGLSGQ